MKRNPLHLIVSIAGFFPLSAGAAILSADFRTESDLPDYSSSGPKVYSSLGTPVGAGYELDSADFLENPAGWNGGDVWIDLDGSSQVLTLASQDTWDFQTFLAAITNIHISDSAAIISVTPISDNLTNDPSIARNITWTSNSIFISYSVTPTGGTFNFTGDIATFQITTAVAPEPASTVLLGLGAFGLLAVRRRQVRGQHFVTEQLKEAVSWPF